MTNRTKADLNDKASLVRAMEGSYAVFTVTNYWEKMDMGLEIDQGKSLADAAKETGVQHYIWSSLLNITKRKLPYFLPVIRDLRRGGGSSRAVACCGLPSAIWKIRLTSIQ